MAKSPSSMRRMRSVVWRYGLSVLSVATALSATLLLQPYVFRTPFFFLSVIVSTWFGGIGPGLLAVLLSTLSINFFLPQVILAPPFHNVPNLAGFVLSALLVSSWSTARRRAEEALRKSEQRFRTFVDHATDAFFLQDDRGVILDVNRQACESLRYTRDELLGMTSTDVDPDITPADIGDINRQLDAGQTIAIESRHRRKDGTVFPVEVRGQAFWEGDRRFTVTLVRDITDRKRAEEALRESEQRWRSLTEALPQLVWTTTPDGACDYLSTQWREYTGIPESDLLGWRWLDVLHPEDRGTIRQFWTDSVAGRGLYDVEFRVRRWDGVYGWFKTRGVPIRDSAGNIFKWFGSCTDITDLRQTEEALRRARNELEMKVAERTAELRRTTTELETILDASPVGIALFGRDHTVQRCNPAFERILGWTADEIVGRSISVLRTNREQPSALAEKLNRGEAFANVETRLLRKDGSEFAAAVACAPLQDEQGKPAGFVGTIEDISDRKRAEEELRRSEAYLAEAQRLSHTGSFALNAATREPTHSSEEHSRLYGFDPEEGIPSFKAFLQRIHPEDRDKVVETFDRAIRERTDFEADSRTVLPDGAIKYLHGIGHPVFNASGDLVELVGTAMDVTERKRAEEERERLLARERAARAEAEAVQQRFRALVNSVEGIVWEADAETFAVSFVNEQVERILGYPLAQWLKEPTFWYDHLHPEDRDWVMAFCVQATAEKRNYDFEYRMVAADGHVVWLRDLVTVVTEGDRATKLRGVMVDITERKRAEEERQAHLWLVESMDRVNRAIQGTNDLEQMMSDVLDAVLAIFACDRAWLVYPCDPEAPSWRAAMEHTRPEFPGAFTLGLDLPVDEDVARVFQAARAVSGPVRFGPGADHPVPAQLWERFGVQSLLAMTVYPKVDKPYLFGLHQCSYPRVWTPQEERLFQAIGRRLEDALTSLLMFRNLRESEAKLEEAQRIAHVGYWDRDLDIDRLTWSDEAYRIFGLGPQDRTITFAGLQDLLHPDDRQLMVRAVAEALGGGPRYDVEYRVVRPGGEVRIVHSQGEVTRDEAGRPRRMFGTVQDITERKRAEEALRRSEAYLTEAQRLTHTGSWAWDVATREFVHWSEEHYRLYGFDPAGGLPPFEAFRQRIHPEDQAGVTEILDRAIRERTDYEVVDYRVVLPDGTMKYLHTVGHPMFNAARELVEFVGTSMNVTERKRAEEALHQAQAELAHVTRVLTMGELTASIAHEVNQPLAAVTTNGNAGLRWLAGDPPNLAEAQECLKRIIRDGTRAGEVIKRIRALVKKAAPAPGPLNLSELIHEVLAMINPEARRHQVAVRTELAAGLPLVRGDRVQVQQVLLNLAMNGLDAMKAVTERPRELVIRARLHDAGTVLVAVQDRGIGLDAQSRERLFEPFYTTKPDGMGMGLAISRTIIEAHGGRLWPVANGDYGATFQFTLPSDEGKQHD
jgi:PAS domain S-box-containing protein